MTRRAAWFDVDKEGLAKIMRGRPKGFLLLELVANAWDAGASAVEVRLTRQPQRRLVDIGVIDDAGGFADLSHAFTMFAESSRKTDPSTRGRFNLGEKLVLACCDEASIVTTSGTVRFDSAGRHVGRERTSRGSIFRGSIRMTVDELDEITRALRQVQPPDGVSTTINGEAIVRRNVVATVEARLATMIADTEGTLRPSVRKTTVDIFEPREGETPALYELGIPVVETGDRYHVDIAQKVPLNTDRDNVRPSFLREVRTLVVNAMHASLTKDDVTSAWVRSALADAQVTDDAVRSAVVAQYGIKSVVNDPSDPEGTKLAVSQGFNVIPSNGYSKPEWDNIRRARAVLPAGKVTPSPRAYDPNGSPEVVLSPSSWTPAMKARAAFASRLGDALLGCVVHVRIVKEPAAGWVANYGRAIDGSGSLTLNLSRLGASWFGRDPTDAGVLALLIHELGHHVAGDHLSAEYHKALCELGARLARVAITMPGLFAGVRPAADNDRALALPSETAAECGS